MHPRPARWTGLLIVLLLILPGAGRGDTGNLLANASFEVPGAGGVLPGWKTSVPHGTAVVRTSGAFPRDGVRCAVLETGSDLAAFLVSDPPVPVAPGEELFFRVWCRAGDLSTSSGGFLQCGVAFADLRGRPVDTILMPVPEASSAGWVPVEGRVTVPARAATAAVQLGVWKMTGRVLWDGAQLRAARPQVVRLSPAPGEHGPGETVVPVAVINRDPAARGREIAVRVRPGGTRLRHTLTGDPVTTLNVRVPLRRRGKVNVVAELHARGSSSPLFVTSQSLAVRPLLEVEPPLPTHFVREEGVPRLEQQVEVHEVPGEREKLTLICALRDHAGQVLASRTLFPIPPNPVTVGLELPPGRARDLADYDVAIALLRGRDVVTSFTQDWHVISRAQSRTVLGADGNLTVDGQPFFPLGLYMAGSYPELQEAGFNVVQHYNPFATAPGGKARNREVKEFLDRAHRHGFKALMFISHGPDRLDEAESLRRVRMFRNHPAVLVWYQEEAVDRGYKPLSYLKGLYDTVKRVDPHHPFLCGDRRDTAARMAGRADIFPEPFMDIGIWWWYPTPLRPTPNIEGYEGEATGEELEHVPPVFLTHSGVKKPLWVALQCYRKPMPTDARFPTPAEYRAQAYIALCHGARGLLYYTGFGESRHGILHRKEEGHWEELKALVGELRAMAPVFMAPDAEETVTAGPEGVPVSTRLKKVDGRRVLLAVNRSVRPAEVTFRVESAGDAAMSVRGEGRTVAARGGVWTDHFGPYAVHIYELPPLRHFGLSRND